MRPRCVFVDVQVLLLSDTRLFLPFCCITTIHHTYLLLTHTPHTLFHTLSPHTHTCTSCKHTRILSLTLAHTPAPKHAHHTPRSVFCPSLSPRTRSRYHHKHTLVLLAVSVRILPPFSLLLLFALSLSSFCLMIISRSAYQIGLRVNTCIHLWYLVCSCIPTPSSLIAPFTFVWLSHSYSMVTRSPISPLCISHHLSAFFRFLLSPLLPEPPLSIYLTNAHL